MSVAIMGADGSMGKRYQCILKYLGKPYQGFDKNDLVPTGEYDAYIIATPTDTHAHLFSQLVKYKKPILIEKPISKNMDVLNNIFAMADYEGTPIQMMSQYDFLVNPYDQGDSYYNYFRHGSDGLAWDCMQIIGNATSDVALEEDSPIWTCTINGRPLEQSQMDFAYVQAVRDWFKYPKGDFGKIKSFHQKTHQYIKDYCG